MALIYAIDYISRCVEYFGTSSTLTERIKGGDAYRGLVVV